MYSLTSSNCFENPLRLVVSCCVVFPCQAPVGSGFPVGPNGDNFWEIRTGSQKILKITGKTQQTYDELVCFPNLYFSILVGKNHCFLHICSLLGLQSSKSYLLNLFVFQIWKACSSINPLQQSPQPGWWFYFCFFSTTWGDDLTIVFKPQQKTGELVFFFGPGGMDL